MFNTHSPLKLGFLPFPLAPQSIPFEFKAYEFLGFPHEEVVLSSTETLLCVLGFEAER